MRVRTLEIPGFFIKMEAYLKNGIAIRNILPNEGCKNRFKNKGQKWSYR